MRKVTSAIEGMSVAEVRRGLDAVRTKWTAQPPRFYFTDKILRDMTVQRFCVEFTLGHHTKRHAKSKRALGQENADETAETTESAESSDDGAAGRAESSRRGGGRRSKRART